MNEELKTDLRAPGQEILDLYEAVKLVPSNPGHNSKEQVCFSLNWRVARCPWYLFVPFNIPGLGAPPPDPSPPTTSMRQIRVGIVQSLGDL